MQTKLRSNILYGSLQTTRAYQGILFVRVGCPIPTYCGLRGFRSILHLPEAKGGLSALALGFQFDLAVNGVVSSDCQLLFVDRIVEFGVYCTFGGLGAEFWVPGPRMVGASSTSRQRMLRQRSQAYNCPESFLAGHTWDFEFRIGLLVNTGVTRIWGLGLKLFSPTSFWVHGHCR